MTNVPIQRRAHVSAEHVGTMAELFHRVDADRFQYLAARLRECGSLTADLADKWAEEHRGVEARLRQSRETGLMVHELVALDNGSATA